MSCSSYTGGSRKIGPLASFAVTFARKHTKSCEEPSIVGLWLVPGRDASRHRLKGFQRYWSNVLAGSGEAVLKGGQGKSTFGS